MHLTTTLAPWSSHDTQLILSCALGLALIIVFISVLKLAPFLSILVGTFAAGFSAGLPLEAVASAFSKGAGALLGDVGIIIALGAMLGALMAESGAADRLVSTILKHSTPRTLPWMMALVALIIGLPLFFEVGLVMMVPIIFVMARRSQQPILRIAIPALAGMTTLHALLLTIGAGGGLKQALVVAGISTTIGKIAVGAHMPLILLAWLIAVALRQATGSATVATTTTAGIVAPVVAGLSTTHNSLMALAIGAGSVFFCHVNDAGFWMVREYFGLQLKQTVLVWSVLQTIVSVVGLALTFALWTVLT